MNNHRLAIILPLLLAACATTTDDTGGDDDGAPQDGPARTEDQGDGSFVTVLDASSESEWTHFDFESGEYVEMSAAVWDIGALRFNIKTNGGTSGDGGAAVAVLDGTSFDAVTEAPADGYKEDAAGDPGVGGEMADITPGYAFDEWFAYNPADHTLAPAPGRIYVVRTPEGNHFKVEMQGYYDDAGTPGFVGFRWAELP